MVSQQILDARLEYIATALNIECTYGVSKLLELCALLPVLGSIELDRDSRLQDVKQLLCYEGLARAAVWPGLRLGLGSESHDAGSVLSSLLNWGQRDARSWGESICA
jgi:hypothetical protein